MKTIKELEKGCGVDFLISCDGISIRVLCGKKNTYNLGKTIISNGIVYCQTCNEVLYRVGEVSNLLDEKIEYFRKPETEMNKAVVFFLEELKSKIKGKE